MKDNKWKLFCAIKTSTFNILSLLLNTYQMNFVYSFIYLVIHVFYGLNISFSFFFFRRLVPWVPKTFLARFPVSLRRCVKTPRITATRERKPLIPRVHQPFHPWANDCCARERNFLCVSDFPKVKIARENFHGYIEKNKRITGACAQGRASIQYRNLKPIEVHLIMTSAYTSCLYTQTLGVGEGRLCKGGDGEAAACVCLGEKFISPTANGVVAVQTYFKALLLVCHAFCHVPGPIFSQIRQSFDRFIHAQNLCSILKFVYRQLHSLRKKPTFTVSPRNDV